MYWTLELASYLSDAPWPASKDELIDFSIRTGAPLEVVEIFSPLKMRVISMNQLKRFGLTTLQKKITSGMKMSINFIY